MKTKIALVEQELISKLIRGTAATLEGPNFSGRTDLLRSLTGINHPSGTRLSQVQQFIRPTVYIGPEVYNSISGLCSTVDDELQLHSGCSPQQFYLANMAQEFGLFALGDRNPFTLSGGEQALLTLTSALALHPSILAVDCALEQIDPKLKVQLLKWLLNGTYPETAIAIADNRMSECEEFSQLHHSVKISSDLPLQGRLRFDPIRDDGPLQIRVNPTSRLFLDSITFRYRHGPQVLNNVSIQLESSKLYTLQGRNGAGKSTLARVLSGVLKPNTGEMIAGKSPVKPWKQPGQLVAYHFQNPDLQLFSTSVEDEIQAGPRALGLSSHECADLGAALMYSFGLSHIRKEHPLDLPFAIRKRVALAATIAMGRPWVILDEPTLGQDISSSEAIAKIITGLVAIGTGVIVISHSLWFRRRLPARTLRLEKGVLYSDDGKDPTTQ